MDFPFIQQTSLWGALSVLGKKIYTPKGIFYWSNRAKKEAEIDGTIGIAQDDDGTISHLEVAEKFAGAEIMKRVPKGKIFGYAPIEGLLSLREKWLKKILENSPQLAKFASLPVVTNGITHSIAIASRLFLDPGQTIVSAGKSWENYEHIFTDSQDIKIEFFRVFNESGEFDIDSLIDTCRLVADRQGKIVLLLNFPHNQTGFMPSTPVCEEIGKRIQKLCAEMPKVPFVVLLDDAYEGYIYDDKGQKSSPLPQIFAKLPNLTVGKMDGISKVFLAYGYRVGFLTFFVNSLSGQDFSDDFVSGLHSEIGTKIGGMIRAVISQVGHHGQVLADALFDDLATVESQRAKIIKMLVERWKTMMQALEDGYRKYGKEKLWADPCNAGFFCYVNLKKDLDSKVVADRLLKEKKIGVVPSESGLRLAFAGVPKNKIQRMVEGIFEVVYG